MQLRAVQVSWEESKQEAKSLNEQLALKDQYAGKLKHLLEKGLPQDKSADVYMQRVSRETIFHDHLHTISLSPFSIDLSNFFLQD